MIYDIRNGRSAAQTLWRLTGIPTEVWIKERNANIGRVGFFDIDEDIERILKKQNGKLPSLDDFELLVTHITSSANQCKYILDKGLRDLRVVLLDTNSELSGFLKSNGVELVIDAAQLIFNNHIYDISRRGYSLQQDTKEKYEIAIGIKIYYDYAVCGFLSINRNQVYAGNVHLRPEILYDIDRLLETDLQFKWEQTHKSYEIVYRIPTRDVIHHCDDDALEEEIVMDYLALAYRCVIMGPRTEEIVCKNNVAVMPRQILKCEEFTLWDKNRNPS